MIVELSAQDVTRLTLGDDVNVGGVTVRLSMSLTESVANGAASLPPSATSNTDEREPVFRMHARFNGRCSECKGYLKMGGPIVRDAVQKRTLCMRCGEPVLAAAQTKAKTAV